MEKITLNCQKREETGKEIVKKLRRSGIVPAIIYGKEANYPIQISKTEMKVLRQHHYSESSLLDIVVDDGGKKENVPAVLKDVQFHPLTEEVIHLDFLKVSLEEKIRVKISLLLKGEPAAVKEGAVLEQILREVEIEAFPMDIPEHIEVDVSALQAGHSLHVGDLKVDDKIRIITHLEEAVATVVSHTEEVEEAPAEGEEEKTEPQVIKEKKEEPKEEKK